MRGCALRAWKVVPVIIACEIWSVSISVEWMRVVLNGFLITRGRVCVWNISGADCVSNDKENTSNVSHAPFRPREDKRVACFRDLHSGRSSMLVSIIISDYPNHSNFRTIFIAVWNMLDLWDWQQSGTWRSYVRKKDFKFRLVGNIISHETFQVSS